MRFTTTLAAAAALSLSAVAAQAGNPGLSAPDSMVMAPAEVIEVAPNVNYYGRKKRQNIVFPSSDRF